MARPKAQPAAADSFETLMARLEQVVHQLEAGERPLAESLALYEEGVELAQRCQHVLATASLRVQQLQVGVESVTLTPWTPE